MLVLADKEPCEALHPVARCTTFTFHVCEEYLSRTMKAIALIEIKIEPQAWKDGAMAKHNLVGLEIVGS